MIESESFRIVAQNPGVSERPRCLASVHNKFTVLQAKQNLELKPKTNNKKKKKQTLLLLYLITWFLEANFMSLLI